VKFSPVEKIASKFANANFQNFCQLASKRSAESAVFLGLEGILQLTIHFFNQTKETATKFELEKRKE